MENNAWYLDIFVLIWKINLIVFKLYILDQIGCFALKQ